MDTETLKGMAVVSVGEGTRLGHIKDLLIDPQALRVVALQVEGNGQTFLVPFDQLQSIGSDAVTVASSQVAQPATAGVLGQRLDLGTLRKLKVVDTAGTLLGAVRNVDIEGTSGQVTRLTVHKGGVLGLGGTTTVVGVEAIQSIGPELVTITAGAGATPAQ